MKPPTGAWRDTRGTLPRNLKEEQKAQAFIAAVRRRVTHESQRAIQDYLMAMASAPKGAA